MNIIALRYHSILKAYVYSRLADIKLEYELARQTDKTTTESLHKALQAINPHPKSQIELLRITTYPLASNKSLPIHLVDKGKVEVPVDVDESEVVSYRFKYTGPYIRGYEPLYESQSLDSRILAYIETDYAPTHYAYLYLNSDDIREAVGRISNTLYLSSASNIAYKMALAGLSMKRMRDSVIHAWRRILNS